ncbi:phosphoribosylglycinamide formyltransferase [Stutzerimonas chloritidismutans]|uniref:phosphoribosylglycinamide formyltransferase n=1 Tax=Stutzerimonas chloritidismutans TaxID=203192 RepID=UPI003F150798
MPATCNVVVLISGSGSNLQALIDSLGAGNPTRIRAVVCNREDALGLQRAQTAGIPTHLVRHKDFADREAFDAALMAIIDEHQPDLVVLAGFMRILTAGFVRHYQGRLLNIHPSLLPRYKGLDTHRRAIEAGDTEHGCSVHFVTEELDGGPVALQAQLAILPGDTLDTLTARVHAAEHIIYPLAVRWFAESRLRLADQGAMLDGSLLPPSGHLVRI